MLCLIKHHAIRTYGGVEVEVHVFLTSVLNVRFEALRPVRFTPGE